MKINSLIPSSFLTLIFTILIHCFVLSIISAHQNEQLVSFMKVYDTSKEQLDSVYLKSSTPEVHSELDHVIL